MTYPNTQLFIAGKWRDASDGRSLEVRNPATGETIGHVAHASKADLDEALKAAQAGFEVWRDKSAAERGQIMRRAASLMRERADHIGTLITSEQGKPLVEAKAEASMAAEILEWFADEGMRVYGRIVPSRNIAVQQQVHKFPVGPVAAFTPWNFPINQIVRKIAPALAAGNSIIVKGPEETPAGPAALVKALEDAGVPSGVVGLVYGDPAEISGYLIPHRVIRKVSFTGSTAVGKHLAALAGTYMKRATMELGGHAPVIVAEDADIELAVRASGSAKFRNAGQVCISPTRFLVQESIYKDFSAAMSKYARDLKVGNGLEGGTQMGPLANPRRITAMEAMTEDALRHGASLAVGGERIGNAGNFWRPTVLTDVSSASKVFNDEPFGPVVAIQKFNRLEEAIAEANRLDYGLAAYAFTGSIKNSQLLSRRVETGMLWINQPAFTLPELPFGGVKDSGYGSEGGPEAMDAYLSTKHVALTSA